MEFEAALAKAVGPAGAHPAAEHLVSYHHDRLGPEDAEIVEEHLASCAECGDFLLELARFEADDKVDDEPDDETDDGALPTGVADLALEADWRALRARIPAMRSSRPLLWSLAASLLLAAGLAAWVVVLQRELAAARRPQPALAILDLRAEGFLRAEDGVEEVPAGVERFVLILNLSWPAEAEHRLDIVDAEGRCRWSGMLWPRDSGNFYLEMSRAFLEPGKYRLHLFLKEEPVAEFELRVAP